MNRWRCRNTMLVAWIYPKMKRDKLLDILRKPKFWQLVEESPDFSHRNAEFWNERISVQLFKYYNDDEEVMLLAASKDPTILEYASNRLKNDPTFSRLKNSKTGRGICGRHAYRDAMLKAWTEPQVDREDLLKILKDPNYLQLVEESPDFSHRNPKFWNARISAQLSKYYSNDEEIMRAAVDKDFITLMFASNDLLKNKDFFNYACERGGDELYDFVTKAIHEASVAESESEKGE